MLLVYLLASCAAAVVGARFTALVTITEFYAALAKPVWAPLDGYSPRCGLCCMCS